MHLPVQGFCVVAFFFGVVPVANERALAALLRVRTVFLDVYKQLLLRNGLRRRVGSKLIGGLETRSCKLSERCHTPPLFEFF